MAVVEAEDGDPTLQATEFVGHAEVDAGGADEAATRTGEQDRGCSGMGLRLRVVLVVVVIVVLWEVEDGRNGFDGLIGAGGDGDGERKDGTEWLGGGQG